VGGSVTDLRGNFSVEAPGNGIFRIKISSVGFQPIEREVTLRRNQSQDLGTLMMSTDAVLLKEAVVTGRAAQVMVKKDTLVYNPDAFRTPEGSPIEELIKRMPGAEVDEDGNITVNGKEVKKILIDGKEFDKNEGITFPLNRVIKGWTEGMKLVGEGGKITLVIPANLAYGERGPRDIGANSTLIFDVDLLEVHPYVEKPAETPKKK
jgi:FKBP-type peptidyl-prolyl cis-trans isomerase